MSALTKAARAVGLGPTAGEISDCGHACWRITEDLQRRMSILDKQPLTVGQHLRGDFPKLDVTDAHAVLAEAQALLVAGDTTFEMMSQRHSLASWAEQLRGIIELACTYRGGTR